MTDDIELMDDEKLAIEAKQVVTTAPEPIPDAAGLPADVRDGYNEDTP